MTATHEPQDRQYPGREEMQALVDGLGPSTLFDLFEEYEVPEDDRFGLIEEVLGLLVVHGRPVENLPAWFVESLEKRCRAFVAAREDGEPAPAGAFQFALVGRVEYLCQASQDEVFRDPRRAVELAERAVELADRIDPGVCGEGIATEQRILARAWLGNARRVASDLNGSERSFQESLRLLAVAVPPPPSTVTAEVQNLVGSLRIDQERYDDARKVLREAAEIYRRLRLQTDFLKVRIKLADAEAYDGHAGAAVRILRRALESFDQEVNPRLYFQGHHNLTLWLTDAGHPHEALYRYQNAQDLYRTHFAGLPSLELRRRWLEGRIYAALGEVDRARTAFEDVRAMAIEREFPYEMGVVSLNLALVCLHQGEMLRVQALAEELVAFFRSRKLHRHLLAAMRLLHEAVRSESVTAKLIEEISVFVERSWNNPQARFVPSDGDPRL